MTKDKELIFEKDRIIVKDNPFLFVMMDWERELMKAHVDLLPNGDILEIGFGMGISANYIQEKGVKSHTICEVNPQILERLKEWSKDKPNVIIIEGDWCETLQKIDRKFDGIFYDADCCNISEVRSVVEPLLNDGGIFTYFEPQGYDRYGFKENLKVENITISCHIPRNIYHNNKICKVPYYQK
jgi:spermidine synthase